jgi:hypothetical protein
VLWRCTFPESAQPYARRDVVEFLTATLAKAAEVWSPEELSECGSALLALLAKIPSGTFMTSDLVKALLAIVARVDAADDARVGAAEYLRAQFNEMVDCSAQSYGQAIVAALRALARSCGTASRSS